MTHLRTPESRTLTLVLSESDWRALRRVEPDAIGWLHERIRERLGSSASSEGTEAAVPRSSATKATSGWDEDLY